jgi:hypothetical protein
MPATLESLEGLLAEAAQCLNDAAGELRALPQVELDRNLRRIGTAINAVWDFRDELHRLRPDLRPNFVVEGDTDHERYVRLSERAKEAHQLEAAGELDRAAEAFSALRVAARRGYFSIEAEAGLFRLTEKGRARPIPARWGSQKL